MALIGRTGAPFAIGVLGGAVFWIAFDRGSFAIPSWATEAIVVWWAILLLVVSGHRRRLSRTSSVAIVLLLGFAVLQGVSAIWASGAEQPFLSLNRTLLYVGVAVFVASVAGGVALTVWEDGLAAGLSAVAAVALASRLYPDTLGRSGIVQFLPDASRRLAYPVDYWNGLAVLVALACPLLLRAASSGRSRLAPFALVPLPAIAVTVYLASSRTGAVTGAVGVILYVVLAPRRWAAAGAALAGVAAAALAGAWAAGQQPLVDPVEHRTPSSALVLHTVIAIVGSGLGGALAYGLLVRVFRGARAPRALDQSATILVTAAVVAGAIAAHPLRQWHSFTAVPVVPTGSNAVATHFLSTNGSWRWQLWRSAWHEFLDRPLLGHGAGSFESWWAQHGITTGYVGNPHSLYAEALGELGIVGLLLVGSALLLAAGIGVRASIRGTASHRSASAAAAAGFIAFAIASGVDWMWELPAAGVVGAVLLGLSIAPATPTQQDRPPVGSRPATVISLTLALLAIAVVVAEADLYLATGRIAASQQAAAVGDLAKARAAAAGARSLEPWAATPYVQLALVNEAGGRLRAARIDINRALSHESRDWRIWLIAARIEVKQGAYRTARASYDRARTFNPRSPVFSAP